MERCSNAYTFRRTFFFIQFVQGLAEFYPELYEPSEGNGQLQENFGKKWGAYATIIEIASGDIRNIDEVTKLPLEQCLLFLAYKADKNQLESLLHRQAMTAVK